MGKSRKKSWKQLPRAPDETISEVHLKRQIYSLPDEEVFYIDTNPDPTKEEQPPALTFKQKTALNHKLYKATLKDESDQTELKLSASFAKMEPVDTKSFLKPISKTEVYDLWADEGKIQESTSDDFDSAGIHHYNTIRNRTRRKAPKGTRFIPTVLPAVEVPKEGASYNPALDSYVAYAEEIVREEVKVEKEEKRIDKKAPAKKVEGVDPNTDLEEFRKLLLARGEDANEEVDEEPTNLEPITKKCPKPKTLKEKKREKLRKMITRQMDRETMAKKQQQELQCLKKTLHNVNKEMEEHKAKIQKRKQLKVLHALTKRKKLGRGEFKPFEEPVLLAEELSGSLRKLPARGNILEERFKSLQKRNILPIAGERKKSNRKASLKVKFVEKRNVKEVKKGSRVL